MAINYGTLGLTLTPPPTYGTAQTSTGGPSPSGMPLFPIGTGKASGTGSVGTTTDRTSSNDNENYTGSLTADQISRISSMPSDPSIRPEATSLKEEISNYLADIMNPNVEFNAVTGTYRNTDFGAASAAAGPFGAIVDTLGGIFGGIAREQTLDIARQAYENVPGYGVASFNGMTIGVRPGAMGTHNIVGNFSGRGELSFAQRQELAENVLGLSNKSGAYSPEIDPANYPKGYDFSILAGQPVGYGYNTNDPMAAYSPNLRNPSGATGIFQNYSGQDVEDSYSPDPGSFNTYTRSDGSMGYDTYGSGAVRTSSGAPVTSSGGAVRTSSWSGGTSGTIDSGSSNDSTDGGHTDSGGNSVSDAGMETGGGWGGDAYGGTITHGRPQNRTNLAPGGRADGPGSESEGHSSHGFDGGRSDAGGNDGGNDNNDRESIAREIQARISSVVQNQPMTPEERFASNAAMIDKTPDIGTLDAYKAAGISVDPVSKPEETGFGQSISEAISALGQYGALGALGLVPFREGGDVTEGFVNKDPKSVSDAQSIADNRYTSVKAGSFVVNQPANEKNKKKLDKVVADASKTAKMKKGGKAGMVDVALSDGERLIEPEVVAAIEKKHGKNFLDKLNDAGKPEVKRRQAKYGEKIGAALGGGFLTDQGMELGDVGEDTGMEEYLPVSDELKAKLSKFAAKKPQRTQIKSFIKSLSPEDKLTVLFLTETQSTTDPVESMEAIGEVVKNRMDSDYYDFKNLKTLDDVLLKQIAKNKSFQFSGLEPTTFYDRAVEVKKGLADKGLAKAAAAAQNVLDPEAEGVQRLPANTLFYTRKDAPSQWMRESKKLEFSTELGGHEFYRTFAAPELP
jgi:hypothetical protein